MMYMICELPDEYLERAVLIQGSEREVSLAEAALITAFILHTEISIYDHMDESVPNDLSVVLPIQLLNHESER